MYYVTARGNAGQEIFLDDEDREAFLETLGTVVARFHWIVHAYCLMTNHYHLLVETPEANLSRGMRQLNGVNTQASIADTTAPDTSLRDGSRRFSSRRRAISWSLPATWC